MPRNDKQSVLLRLIELLKLLPSRPGDGKSAHELTIALRDKGYKISQRQVERDLNMLMEAFPLDWDERTNPQGWKWREGASLNIPGMTTTDALSMVLIEGSIRTLFPRSMLNFLEIRFDQAKKQLTVSSKENREAKWANKVRTVSPTLPLIPPAINPNVLATVQEALLADEKLEIDYRAMQDDQKKSRRLNPLALVNRGATTYLVANKVDSDEIRLYALHRIKSAKRTYETAVRPENFDLDDYIEKGGLHFGSGKNIRLKAKITSWLARILVETPLSKDQALKIQDDHVQLMTTVPDSWQLTWWILSYGSNIEVVSPVSLRRKVGEMLKDAAGQYTKRTKASV